MRLTERQRETLKHNNLESNRVTREAIQGALYMLMERKPYDEITMTDIVRRSGISRSALYRNYRTKEDIILDIVNEFMEFFAVYQTDSLKRNWTFGFQYFIDNKKSLDLIIKAGVEHILLDRLNERLRYSEGCPDMVEAMTVITQDNYRELVWPLPASDLFYCGPATTKKLANYGIHTIGDIAATSPVYLRNWLGINGVALWNYAAGTDTSRVMTDGWETPIKSVGHGVTCVSDLLDEEEVWRVILELSQDVGHRLRVNGFLAKGVQIMVEHFPRADG